MAIPIIDVSSVAQASSFYSSILQPLGIWYIGTTTDAQLGTSVTFGYGVQPVLQIHQFNRQSSHLRLSAIVLEVPSCSAVSACLDMSRRANPDGSRSDQGEPVTSHATIHDLDGNRLCLLSQATAVNSSTGYHVNGAARVLGWTYDVASPHQDCIYCGKPSVQEINSSPAALSDDTGAMHSVRVTSDTSNVSSSTILGALLGAAAGAALTYGLMSTDNPKQDQEPKPNTNRADPARTVQTTRSRGESSRTIKNSKPASASTQRITFEDQTKVSVQRTAPTKRSIPRAESALKGNLSAKSNAKVPSAYSLSKLAIAESNTCASKSTTRPEKTEAFDGVEEPTSASQRSRTARSQISQSYATAIESGRDTFVSARSHPASVVSRARISIPPKTSSRVSSANRDTRSRTSARPAPASHISARNVPLPSSEVGSSHANWDDDRASLAPSDSISCVGSKALRNI